MISEKDISVAIITFNAERTIRACLESVKWAGEIIIVDSGSTDNTVSIAREYTGRILTRKFDNFSSQKNYAISQTARDWVLSIDGDEVASDELRRAILDIGVKDNIHGFFIERLNNIYGRFVEYARPDLQLRFFRRGKGIFEQPVHERIFMAKENTAVLRGKLHHFTMDSISHHVRKIDEFTRYDVDYYPAGKIGFFWIPKNLIIRPMLKFIQHYIFKGAYKDGVLGYIFAVNTIAGEFLTQAKYMEKHLKGKR